MSEVIAKKAYHHGDLREQLLAATRSLVEEKGPDGFSVSEACRAAGVSTAAPYKHFSDRTDMLRAVALQGFKEMTAAIAGGAEGKTPGTVEAIAAMGTAYVAFAEAHPETFKMMFAFKGSTPQMEEAGTACYATVLQQVAIWSGRTEVDARVLELGFPLWTFVHGLSFLRIDGKATPPKFTSEVADVVLDATRRLLAGTGAG